jgi:hypothetical protein
MIVQGATQLVEHCVRILGCTDAFAKRVLRAYKDFLECKRFLNDIGLKDHGPPRLVPSIPIDEMWSLHTVDTTTMPETATY